MGNNNTEPVEYLGAGWKKDRLTESQQTLVDSVINDHIFGRDSSDLPQAVREAEDLVKSVNPKLWPYVLDGVRAKLEEPKYLGVKDKVFPPKPKK